MSSKSFWKTQDWKSKRAESLALYGPDWTLMPLHMPDDVSTITRKGKTIKRKDGKRPRDSNWTTNPYNSAKVLARCIEEGRNIGVRLKPTQLVLDIDPRNGGTKGFKNLCRDLELDPTEWPCDVTGSGGLHYYMTKPGDVPIVDTLAHESDTNESKRYSGVEFKSVGRQVVAAGSTHPDTLEPYDWDAFAPPLADAPECPAKLLELITRPERHGTTEGGQATQEDIARVLDKLDPTDFKDHHKWLRLKMACHHASGGDARQEFIDWSVSDPEFADDAEVIGRRWDSLHADKVDGVTARTLNHFLREAGALDDQIKTEDPADDFEDDLPNSTSTEVVAIEQRGLKLQRNIAPDTYENACCAVMQAGLGVAFNEVSQTVVFRAETLPWPESYGRVLNDHVLRLVRLYLLNKHQGVAYQPGKDHLFEAVMTMAYAAKFNPVVDYLDSLKWDGVSRLERLFSDYFSCADDAYTRAVSRCYMIGAVRRARHPGCKFDTTPVLKGPQGIGKSTGVKTLFGPDYYSDTDLGNLRDKDAAMKLRGLWVHEFSEIDSLTRGETNVLKAFLSSATDRQRDPYGRIVENSPRRNVHFATVNEGGYLKDGTGSRRFWPLQASKPIELARLAKDRDQLWAEAAALEAQGESDVLSNHLWPVAAERQAAETSADPWIDVLRLYLDRRAWEYATHDPAAADNDDAPPLSADRVHTVELYGALGIHADAQTKDKAQRIRTAMESGLGWIHRKAVRVGDDVLAGYVRG